MTDKDVIHAVKDRARELYDSKKYNCAESTFLALNEVLKGGIEPQTALRVATGLGGGLGGTGGTCGALTGCVMALGLLAEDDPDIPRKKTIYPMAAALQKKFKAQFGSCICRTLIRDTGEDRRKHCSTITVEAAALCAAMLLEGKKAG